MSPQVAHTLSVIAAAVLAFDGVAIAALGVWTDRAVLIPVGVAFFVASVLVLFYWRWYRRRLDDIAATRKALGDAAREMQRVVREK